MTATNLAALRVATGAYRPAAAVRDATVARREARRNAFLAAYGDALDSHVPGLGDATFAAEGLRASRANDR